MKYVSLILLICGLQLLAAQDLTAKQLLDKAIAYHDPNNQWPTFNHSFDVVMESPNASNRYSHIVINLPEDYFQVKATRDSVITSYTINKGKCLISLSDSIRIANLEKPPSRSHCETAALYKDYYTYLYGLPMKLKDPGTLIDDQVVRKTFKGKDYLVLKVSYEKSVGTDVWYFYFNPKTYAMEVYQFFKTDDNGSLDPTSGEYILLSDMTTIDSIRMPKIRAWYYNKDDTYLGTDTLQN